MPLQLSSVLRWRGWAWVGPIVIAIIIVIVAAWPYLRPTSYRALSSSPKPTVNLQWMRIEAARTDAARERGLSGRPSLAQDQGMIFLFPQTSRRRFWMNGMRFPLDILWLRDGRVVDGVTLEPPRQKPDGTMADPAIYESSEPANQILEVQAGFARAQGIGIGTVLQLPPY